MGAVKTSLSELLDKVDSAFEEAQGKASALVQAREAQAKAVADAQVVFDAVKADHHAKVDAAASEDEKARRALDELREAMNARLGSFAGKAQGWSQAR